MRRITIEHTTEYLYAEAVRLLEHRLLIRPREGHDVRIESSKLDITPGHDIVWHRDIYDNSVALVTFGDPTKHLVIESEVVVQHYDDDGRDYIVAPAARSYPFAYDPGERSDVESYLLSGYPRDRASLSQWLGDLWFPGKSTGTIELLDALNSKIAGSIRYEAREAPDVQSPGRTLERGIGSCRDMATLFIEACRSFGMGSRFVSGYLLSSAAVTDLASTHAWSEVYLPSAGWLGFDSTGAQHVKADHVAVAVHRDPAAVPPVSGSFVGSTRARPVMRVSVRATRVG